ncbi:7c4585aa-45f6-4647-96b8-1d51f414cb38 [Sclerotinia trifoliorum]|uniref:7c4585aa-45f6-4647-96b8-1d51f414cb38 n=1 Tax=Sclerotinia trifoliorum TaxID=28548 RepID=A0A8H2VXY2_9HELO|nr:7c4585aa-45f6-4647-96b8-1d51f414cb38 [Sclerotinia trifoliorum]
MLLLFVKEALLMRRKLLATENFHGFFCSNRSVEVEILFLKMAFENSAHTGDLRRDLARTRTVKNQYPSSNSPPTHDTLLTSNNAYTPSNTQKNPQTLNSQTLYRHTIDQAQLFQEPYHAHIIQQKEARSLQSCFSSLGVDIPSDFYQSKVSGIYQNRAYASVPEQTYKPTRGYSTQYFGPASTMLPADDDYHCAEICDEYKINKQDVTDLADDLNGIGGQFPVFAYQMQSYSASISQLEADIAQRT